MYASRRGSLGLVFLVVLVIPVSAEEKPEFRKVDRGPIAQTIVERGVVEPVNPNAVVCQVKSRGRTPASATTIRWIIDDGSVVRKGDKIIELDASAIQDEMKARDITVEQAKAQLIQAELGRKIAEEQGRSDIQIAELRIELAKAETKSSEAGVEAANKILDIKVRRAKLAVELAKVQQGNDAAIKLATQMAELELELAELEKKKMTADETVLKKRTEVEIATAVRALSVVKTQVEASVTKAEGEVKAAKSKVVAERGMLSELEQQLSYCTIVAPADGLLLIVQHERSHTGFGGGISVVAQGEPVREGQKLAEIVDLSKLRVATQLHEVVVSQARKGQSAKIRVDAFPQRTFEAHVQHVSAVAVANGWVRGGPKVYTTWIDFTRPPDGLKPGMTAEVSILVAEQANALRVPNSAVVIVQRQAFCFVKNGDKVEKREVKTGIRESTFVEIKNGVNEGDEVLVNPRVLPPTAGAGVSASLIVNSVKPANEGNAGRSFVESYGLSLEDLDSISKLNGVLAAVPERRFSVEVRSGTVTHQGRLVATTNVLLESESLRLRSGRFLSATDSEMIESVVVLGSEVALRLFPKEEPVGKTVEVGSGRYSVIGVLAADDRVRESRNNDVFAPLSTCQAKFGSTVAIRRAGTRTMEQVAVHQITIIAPSEKLPRISGEVEEMLKERHPAGDWSIKRK